MAHRSELWEKKVDPLQGEKESIVSCWERGGERVFTTSTIAQQNKGKRH
jgi:hypothetical protein